MAGKGRKRTPKSTPAIRRAQNATLATTALANLGQRTPEGFDPKRMPSDKIAQNGHQALSMMRAVLGLDEGLLTASMREIRAHVTMAMRGDEIVDAELDTGAIRFRYRFADQAFPVLWTGRMPLSFEEFLPLTITGGTPATAVDALRRRAHETIKAARPDAIRTAADLRHRFEGMFDRAVEPVQLLTADDTDMGVEQMDRLIGRYVATHHAGDHAAEERRRMAIEDPRLLHLDVPVGPRKVLALLGPTNSGKTHEGLNLLCASETGAYLGPLRLMALENHEAILGRGVACSLLTGEEEIRDPDAGHVSATVEMFEQSKHWGTVLIDEIQMLADPDRGWAWARAFLSASTDLLIVAGSPDAEPLIRRLAAMNGDEIEVRRFERRNALHVSYGKATWDTIRKGDALVAFSRDDVLGYKAMAESRGFRAAAVYGALGPEARHEQARRFREGDVDILVATDAIGMGLNLPIDRVIFTRLDKWDGHEVRPLTGSETRQVAGRAGRFSSTCPGEVTVMTGAGKPEKLDKLMKGPSLIDEEGPMPMQPGWAVVSRVITERNLRLESALSLIANALIGHRDASYTVTDDVIEIMKIVDGRNYTPHDRFRHLGLPLSMRTQANKNMLSSWVRRVNAGVEVPAPTLAGLKPSANADTIELRRIEDAVQQAGAYMWLGRRFPEQYPHVENARDTRKVGTEYITAILSQKTLKRPCATCGNGLPAGHRHTICDPCFNRGRDEDW
jgi:hypothetical protein